MVTFNTVSAAEIGELPRWGDVVPHDLIHRVADLEQIVNFLNGFGAGTISDALIAAIVAAISDDLGDRY